MKIEMNVETRISKIDHYYILIPDSFSDADEMDLVRENSSEI